MPEKCINTIFIESVAVKQLIAFDSSQYLKIIKIKRLSFPDYVKRKKKLKKL